MNFTSDFGSPSSHDDWTGFFTELHLRRPLIPGSDGLGHLDWNLMWADGHPGHGVGRVGIRWRLHDTPGVVGETLRNELNLNYALTVHFAESDGSGWQMEHVYRRTFLDGLIYVGGFADHNINGSFADSAWVTETQVGIKLVRNFYAVCEYRYNSFAPSRYRSGWGFGVEYFVPFP